MKNSAKQTLSANITIGGTGTIAFDTSECEGLIQAKNFGPIEVLRAGTAIISASIRTVDGALITATILKKGDSMSPNRSTTVQPVEFSQGTFIDTQAQPGDTYTLQAGVPLPPPEFGVQIDRYWTFLEIKLIPD